MDLGDVRMSAGAAQDGPKRIFLREIASATYGLVQQREALLSRARVRGSDVVVDDGQVAHESQSEDTRNLWRLAPGDPAFLTQTVQLHIVELPPHSENRRHAHQNEALFYVLEGAGYDVHDGLRYAWSAGDLVCIHSDSVHQHFNPHDAPARLLIVKAKAAWMYLGLIQQGSGQRSFSPKEYGDRLDWSALWTPGLTELTKVVRGDSGGWRLTPEAFSRPLTGPERPDVRHLSLTVTEQSVPPGSSSARRWRMADEVIYVLEGAGHSLHWQVEADFEDRYYARIASQPRRFAVRTGDMLYVPPNTVAQHTNDGDDRPLRLLSVRNRLFDHLGYRAVVYLEVCPEYGRSSLSVESAT